MSTPKPLHELDPTGRFSDRAADYAKHRPSYPREAIDAILGGLGPPGELVAADVGAGTGISSRLLADRGVRVIAIEPNEEMRLAASSHDRVEFRSGTAESTALPDGSVDLVVSAQAFHWFRHEEALAEFARVLKAVGRVALVWNSGDERDALTRGYYELIRKYAVDQTPQERFSCSDSLMRSPLYRHARERIFSSEQMHDEGGLVGRALSASYAPKSGPDREALERALRHLHAAHDDAAGRVTMRYRTLVYLAEKE